MITEREESAGKPTNCESKLPNGKAMTRENIFRMAVEAGARDCANPDKWDIWEIRDTDLERFANLVAAHEREECAKVCDEAEIGFEELCDKFAHPHDQGMADASHQLAAAIRARGEK